MEIVDTDPYLSFNFYMKEQIFDSYQKECISLLTVPFVADLKLVICSWIILNGVTQ